MLENQAQMLLLIKTAEFLWVNPESGIAALTPDPNLKPRGN